MRGLTHLARAASVIESAPWPPPPEVFREAVLGALEHADEEERTVLADLADVYADALLARLGVG